MKKNTKIISAFLATGKSFYYNNHKDTSQDSDSSRFDKDDFPNNYINHIKSSIGNVDIIFVSSHKEVRNALVDNNIPFTLIYPKKELKNEYLDRYIRRGNSSLFIELIENNWDMWIDECMEQKCDEKHELDSMIFITDILEGLK